MKSSDLFDEIVLNNQYKIHRSSSKMELEIDFSKISLGSLLFLAFIFLILVLLSNYLIIMIYPPKDLFYISFFVLLIFISTFFFCITLYFFYLYFRNKNRVDIIIFNKKENKIVLRRKLPENKEFIKIYLTDVQKINYFHRTGGYGIAHYYLFLILKNSKKIKIISGAKSKVKSIGEHISAFLHIPLINEEPKPIRELLITFLIFGVLFYFGIFLPFYSGLFWLGIIFAYSLVISIVISLIIVLLIFKLKKISYKKKIG